MKSNVRRLKREAPVEGDVGKALDALRRLVRVLRLSSHAAEKRVGVSMSQLFVLQHLAERPHASVKDLAELTLTDQSSVSVVVSRLADTGLVIRGTSSEDARRAEVSLTPKGRAVLRKAPEPAQFGLIAALRRRSPAELKTMARVLQEIGEELGADDTKPLMFFEDPPSSPGTRRRKVRAPK